MVDMVSRSGTEIRHLLTLWLDRTTTPVLLPHVWLILRKMWLTVPLRSAPPQQPTEMAVIPKFGMPTHPTPSRLAEARTGPRIPSIP